MIGWSEVFGFSIRWVNRFAEPRALPLVREGQVITPTFVGSFSPKMTR
jgi:hypothetical protein